MKTVMKTKYHYRVVLNRDRAEKESDLNGMPLYVIYYRGERKLIGNRQFEWSEEEPLKEKEIFEVFEGTQGVEEVYGPQEKMKSRAMEQLILEKLRLENEKE